MAGETQSVDDAAVNAQVEEQDLDADFDAGFAGAATGTTETPTPEGSEELEDKPPEVPASATPAATETPPVQPTATPAPAPGPKKVEVDESELLQLRQRAAAADTSLEQITAMNQKFDKAFGQIGSLKQVVEKLRTETPAGEAVEINEADFKELAEAYPEIGKLTAQGLNKVLGKFKGTGGADPEAIDKMVTERVQAARTEITTEVTAQVTDVTLNGILPKWRQKVNTPEFAEWKKAQPPEVQALAESSDVSDAADMLRRFRRHLERPAPTPAPSAAPAAPAKGNVRQRQIAAAVTVRGDGAPSSSAPVTDDDDFDSGFKAGKV
jgi:DNA uptake protein ComE-like DNA-binding protein